jgi:hypothetical protein
MNSAIISECGLYRTRLDRECCPSYAGSLVYAYFGVNPSTADASINDQTVKKWIGFTVRNNGHRFIVGNVFSYRATVVKDLAALVDTVPLRHDDHHWHIKAIIAEADILVPCWGRVDKLPRALRGYPAELMELLLRSGKPVLHFGKTKSGDPTHPQMLGYDTPLTPWSRS